MYEVDGNFVTVRGTATLRKSAGRGGEVGARLIEGVASTATRDLHGERVEPMGFDLTYFARHGRLNWDHGKGPSSIIGEPVDWNVTKKRFWLQGRLYENVKLADETFTVMSAGAVFAWSVEGKVLERDPADRFHVLKALVINCAVTPNPVNPDAECSLCDRLAKALDLEGGAALVPQSLEGAHQLVLSTHLAKSRQACGCMEGDGHAASFVGGYEGAVAHFASCCAAPIGLAMALGRNHSDVARATGHLLSKGR
jgi:hypothetical protein